MTVRSAPEMTSTRSDPGTPTAKSGTPSPFWSPSPATAVPNVPSAAGSGLAMRKIDADAGPATSSSPANATTTTPKRRIIDLPSVPLSDVRGHATKLQCRNADDGARRDGAPDGYAKRFLK